MQEFRKRVVARLGMPYPLGVVSVGGERCVAAATEDHGPILLSRPPYRDAEQIAPGPGGCMALVTGGDGSECFAIMGCFTGYKFQSGGIYRIRREPGREAGAAAWSSSRILDLPFAHRMDFVQRAGKPFLVAASIARNKKDAADWSLPGTVYAAAVPPVPDGPWTLQPILEGVHRNHGFLLSTFQGVRSLLVTGAEGIFAASLEEKGERWTFQHIMEKETSELALFDLDGDGRDELITIEPFHGASVRAYSSRSGGWAPAWESEIAFGHCLLAGTVNGSSSVLVSNRAGSKDLLLFQWPRGKSRSGVSLANPERIVVDAGVGAANMVVIPHEGRDLIFSTNQVAGEVACYSVEEGVT